MASDQMEKPSGSWREFWFITAAISATLASLVVVIDYFAHHLIVTWHW